MSLSKAGYDIGFVGANDFSNQQLASGVYSLSSRSNVPYVTLVGSGGFQKTFSWGEIVQVPEGESCQVKNSSFHAGDIYINAGCDYDVRPARITVPVPLVVDQNIAGNIGIGTLYPVDARMGRRAYFIGNLEKNAVGTGNVLIMGQRFDGSHNTANELAPIPGAGYLEFQTIPLNTIVGPVPLGKRAQYGSNDSIPHALLTTARVLFLVSAEWGFTFAIQDGYYVVEY